MKWTCGERLHAKSILGVVLVVVVATWWSTSAAEVAADTVTYVPATPHASYALAAVLQGLCADKNNECALVARYSDYVYMLYRSSCEHGWALGRWDAYTGELLSSAATVGGKILVIANHVFVVNVDGVVEFPLDLGEPVREMSPPMGWLVDPLGTGLSIAEELKLGDRAYLAVATEYRVNEIPGYQLWFWDPEEAEWAGHAEWRLDRRLPDLVSGRDDLLYCWFEESVDSVEIWRVARDGDRFTAEKNRALPGPEVPDDLATVGFIAEPYHGGYYMLFGRIDGEGYVIQHYYSIDDPAPAWSLARSPAAGSASLSPNHVEFAVDQSGWIWVTSTFTPSQDSSSGIGLVMVETCNVSEVAVFAPCSCSSGPLMVRVPAAESDTKTCSDAVCSCVTTASRAAVLLDYSRCNTTREAGADCCGGYVWSMSVERVGEGIIKSMSRASEDNYCGSWLMFSRFWNPVAPGVYVIEATLGCASTRSILHVLADRLSFPAFDPSMVLRG